jgi:hypothetical protein
LVKKITDFFHRTIGAAAGLKRRAEGIKKNARNITGSSKETTFKDGGLWRALNVNASSVSAAGIVDGLKATGSDFERNVTKDSLTKLVNETFEKSNLADMTDRDGLGVASAVADSYFPGAKVISSGTGAYQVRAAGTGSAPNGFKPGGNDSFDTFGTLKDLPGNKCVWAGVIKGTVQRTTALSSTKDIQSGFYTQNQTYKADAKKEAEHDLKVLSTNEVQGICDTVIANMNIIIKSKTQADKKLNDVAVMKKAGDKLISTLKDEEADGGGAKTRATDLINAVVDANRRTNSLHAMQLRYNYSTSKSALSYCQRSLKQYKGGDK